MKLPMRFEKLHDLQLIRRKLMALDELDLRPKLDSHVSKDTIDDNIYIYIIYIYIYTHKVHHHY